MDKLSMIKAIAGLEGLKIEYDHLGKPLLKDVFSGMAYINGVPYSSYNPFTDSHLNRKLILKYKVNVIKYHHSVTIVKDNGGFGLKCTRATYNTDDDLPYAVVECILKANGLWITNNK